MNTATSHWGWICSTKFMFLRIRTKKHVPGAIHQQFGVRAIFLTNAIDDADDGQL